MVEQSLWDSVRWHWRSWDELRSMSWFTMSNYINILLLIGLVFMAVMQTRSKIEKAKKDSKGRAALPAPNFPPVARLEDFDWRTTEPIKLRPLKAKFYLTMADSSALETLEPNELIVMDKNYKDRIDYRRRIIKEHHDVVVAVHEPRIGKAVREMYTFLMGTYLPTRFPGMFKLHETMFEQGRTFMLENIVTGEVIPATPSSRTKTITLLETLGKHLDEDFLLLLPEKDTEKDPKYVLEAYITVCPSGFNPREKLGKKLRDIHGPVPGYEEKLESSMDRFFAKVEVGKYVKRVNWSLTTNAELYAAGAGTTHAHEGDEVEELETIDVDQTFMRCERQTLYRLPESQALVFAFKTYLYPIKDLKDEGLGEQLAEAIDGLKGGNVPQMHFYKRGAVWGEAAKKYLRS